MGQTRRQQRQRQQQQTNIQSVDDVPMAQPDRSGPTGKTLFELAEEREAELWAQADAANASRRGQAAVKREERGATEITAREEQALTALFYTITLSMLHFTLSVLAHHQYAQDLEVPWSALAWDTAWPFAPFLLTLIWLAHTPTAFKLPVIRQGVLAALAAASGCRLVRIGNQEAYLAVMRNAPPVGVLWVWAVIELKLAWAVASLAVVGGWVWLNGFGLW